MPELPDLQVFSRNLKKTLGGKKVKSVAIINKKKIKTSEKDFKKILEGATVKDVVRDGKELHFLFDNDAVLGLHMMLRGKLELFEKVNDKKFTIIEILFADGTGLSMSDYQGQATPTLNPEEKDGVDALSKDVDFDFLKTKLGKSKAAVKNVLLDQKFIRGIGNAYADEIFWEAGISPFSISNKIPDEYIKALVKAIKNVLASAEKNILKSNPEIIAGEVRDFLNVHNSKREKTPRGEKILHDDSGRKTYYTKEQKEFK